MASSSKTPPEGELKPRLDPSDGEGGRPSDVSRMSEISRQSVESDAPVDGSSAAVLPPAPRTDELDKDNPFEKDTDNDLTRKIREYSRTEPELEEYFELLKSGAQLAKDGRKTLASKAFRSGLSAKQKAYLKDDEDDEKDGKDKKMKKKAKTMEDARFWGQSKYLKGSLLSACLAGIIQGWTQSAMNGANIGITAEFNLFKNDPRNTRDLWLFGVLNAIPFLAGGLLAPFVSDPLQEQLLGRRGAIAVACALSIAATVGQSFSTSIAQIIGCRIITGLTLAAKASSAPLLTAEVAPNYLRGKLLSTWQLSDAFGIFLGFSSNLATLNINAKPEKIWRIQIATILIPTIILLFLVYFMPESPRYLMKRGKPLKALEAFTMLRPSPFSRLLAARDLVYAHFQLQMECKSINKRREERVAEKALKQEEKQGKLEQGAQEGEKDKKTPEVTATELTPSDKNGKGKDPNLDPEKQSVKEIERPLYVTAETRTTFFRRMKQTFNDARSRRALVCASTAMISQQLTGINTITFLSATLLKTVNASDRSGAWVGFGIGLCNFVFGAPAFWLFDYVGRATMLLLGFVPMFIFMLVLAFSFKSGVEGDARVPLVSVFGILFIVAYSPTAGTSPFAISAEVFPLVVREVGHSLAVAVNFFGLGIVLLVFPSMSGAMGGYRGSLGLFAGLNIVALVLCFLFVPETKGTSLEELRAIFDIPTREHINYRVKYVAPWLWKRSLRLIGVKVKPKGGSQGQTPGKIEGGLPRSQTTYSDQSMRDFRSWWKTERLRRDHAKAQAAPDSGAVKLVPQVATSKDQATPVTQAEVEPTTGKDQGTNPTQPETEPTSGTSEATQPTQVEADLKK